MYLQCSDVSKTVNRINNLGDYLITELSRYSFIFLDSISKFLTQLGVFYRLACNASLGPSTEVDAKLLSYRVHLRNLNLDRHIALLGNSLYYVLFNEDAEGKRLSIALKARP